jgi:hypothetical protein
MKVEIFVDALNDRGFQNGDPVNFTQKSFNWLLMGVRRTNCRGRLPRSGTMSESLPQLANMLTILELQN